MTLKRKIKKTIVKYVGMDNVQYIFSKYKYFRTKKYKGQTRINKKYVDNRFKIFEIKDRHVFFGYFDNDQIDKNGEKLLVTSVNLRANTKKDVAYIGYFNIKNDKKEYVELITTKAWCWQQGARLRFHPFLKNVILYNDIKNGNYVCREFDIEKKMILNTYCGAFYDVDVNMKYAIGLNYSRLQRLRPGYGYDKLEDTTSEINAPDNDGIYKIDIKNNTKELLISLKDLARENDSDEKYHHYINHLSISPNGDRFIFFHIYAIEGYTKWKTRLFVMNMDGGNRKLLEDEHNASHYCWMDNENILITLVNPGKEQYYAMYNVITGEKNVIGKGTLTLDGHPWILKNHKSFISDTYPDDHSVQHIYIYDMENGKKKEIAALYSDARLYMEKRCDLHPRVFEYDDKIVITVDSTFADRRRKVLQITVSKEKLNKYI